MRRGRGEVGFLLDMPATNESAESGDSLRASFWKSELRRSFKSISTMKMASFQMGVFGHRARRPTTIATSYPALRELEGVHEPVDGCLPSTLMDSRELRKWSGGFKALVAEAVVEYHDVKLSKLSKHNERSGSNTFATTTNLIDQTLQFVSMPRPPDTSTQDASTRRCLRCRWTWQALSERRAGIWTGTTIST